MGGPAAVHRIEIRNRGGRIVTAAEDRPLLTTLEAAGLSLPFGCRYGACATCAAFLVSGSVDYRGARAVGLRREQHRQGYILLCVARPRTDCVIEVGVQKGLYRNPFMGRQRAHYQPTPLREPGHIERFNSN